MPEEQYPIMVYVKELETKVRTLRWQLTCHRLGSFVSGFVLGMILALGLALYMIRR